MSLPLASSPLITLFIFLNQLGPFGTVSYLLFVPDHHPAPLLLSQEAWCGPPALFM